MKKKSKVTYMADGGLVTGTRPVSQEKPSVGNFIADRIRHYTGNDSTIATTNSTPLGIGQRMEAVDALSTNTTPAPEPTVVADTSKPEIRFADGGRVPGDGNEDTQPAMLTPGEFVMPKDSVARIGVGNLKAMKNATHMPVAQMRYNVPHMANGGMLDDYDPLAATKANFEVGREGIGKAKNAGQAVGAGIGALGKTAGGAIIDATRFSAIPAVAAADFAGDVYKGITDPGGSDASPAQQAPARPVSHPQQNVAPAPNVTRGTIAATPPAAPARQPAAPAQRATGGDGMATDTGGNPIPGFGAFRNNRTGAVQKFAPGPAAQPAPAGGNVRAAYAPTDYTSLENRISFNREQMARAEGGSQNITAGLDLTSPAGVAAFAARAAPVIMQNVGARQQDRRLGLGIQSRGQELQNQASRYASDVSAASSAATNQANLGIHRSTNDTQERIAAANNASAQQIEESRASAIKKNAQVIHGRAIPRYDENGIHIGTDYEPDKILTTDENGAPVLTNVPAQTPAPQARPAAQQPLAVGAATKQADGTYARANGGTVKVKGGKVVEIN